jgi:glycosyltransferase involved in cell wall biosynthesis
MNDYRFSVSMCVYGKDNPEWFKTAVDSILNQTLKPDEVVLVVDGPVPEELDKVISEYEKNTLFKVIRLEENQGHGNARRIGLSNCTFDLVALMDADDISVPNRFEKQIKVFKSVNDLDIVGGIITEFIGDPNNIVGHRVVPNVNKDIREFIKKRCPMNQMTVMLKKSSVERVGGYIDWYCEEDYYLWIRMYLAGMKFANVPDVLVNVRVGKDMYKRRGGLKYFISEAKLQKFMLKNKIISLPLYVSNVFKRLIVQLLMPSWLRGWVFQKFARERV